MRHGHRFSVGPGVFKNIAVAGGYTFLEGTRIRPKLETKRAKANERKTLTEEVQGVVSSVMKKFTYEPGAENGGRERRLESGEKAV